MKARKKLLIFFVLGLFLVPFTQAASIYESIIPEIPGTVIGGTGIPAGVNITQWATIQINSVNMYNHTNTSEARWSSSGYTGGATHRACVIANNTHQPTGYTIAMPTNLGHPDNTFVDGWVIYGSNDNITFDVLDTLAGGSGVWNTNESTTRSITTNNTYNHYCLNGTSTIASDSGQIAFFGIQGVLLVDNPPVINSTTLSNDTIEQGSLINVTINVTDDTAISTVLVGINNTNLTASPTTGDLFVATIDTTSLNAQAHTVSVWVNDSANQIDSDPSAATLTVTFTPPPTGYQAAFVVADIPAIVFDGVGGFLVAIISLIGLIALVLLAAWALRQEPVRAFLRRGK